MSKPKQRENRLIYEAVFIYPEPISRILSSYDE